MRYKKCDTLEMYYFGCISLLRYKKYKKEIKISYIPLIVDKIYITRIFH